MSLKLISWAWDDAPLPASELHNGIGSIYKPMAKLLLVALADNGDQGNEEPGYIADFPALCESIWMHPGMGTMVLDLLVRDGLVEINQNDVTRVEDSSDDLHPDGIYLEVWFRLEAGR